MTNAQIQLTLVFFIYGLAFFTMGLALLLETGRTPRLAERRVLRPLAAFGLLHGMHEWLEIFLLQGAWLGHPFPTAMSAVRVTWLTMSFLPLLLFSAISFVPRQDKGSLIRLPSYAAVVFFCLFLFSLFLNYTPNPEHYVADIDVMARYLLAVPSGVLAGISLHYRAQTLKVEGRRDVARRFALAAIGFALYGLTQVFVSPGNIPSSQVVNTILFQEIFQIPVQLARGATAVFITYHLIRAIQIVGREREQELFKAQKDRLAALEQVQHDMEEREVLRRELLRHTVIAQEEERARIARELHDETAQVLTAFSLSLASLQKGFRKNTKNWALLERLQGLSRQMSDGIYRLVRDLRPAQLDDLGLSAALSHLSEEAKTLGMDVSVDVIGNRTRLEPIVETVFFRVAQEALTNVSRHAGVSRAQVQLIFSSHLVTLRVCDEGAGFEPIFAASPQKGWGLAGMQERAESIGAEFRLVSGPGRGTIVEMSFPVDVAAAPEGYRQ